ncbi:hypothetical protein ACFW04_012931 [Cataglyphis niger]
MGLHPQAMRASAPLGTSSAPRSGGPRPSLKSWALPVTKFLEPEVFDGVLEAFFPLEDPLFGAGGRQRTAIPWLENLEVSKDEMVGMIRQLKRRGNKAPDPDGIPGRIWGLALTYLSGRLRRFFTNFLRRGMFPSAWVRARLVLIPKGAGPMRKLLERVLINRLVQHLSREGMDLHRDQYGFRGGRRRESARPVPRGVHHGGEQGGACGIIGYP